MTVRTELLPIERKTGLSTDTKPTTLPIGSEFFEYDTGLVYKTWDGTNWAIMSGVDAKYKESFRKLVSGDLAADGVQWSAEVDTAAANTDVAIFSKTISEVKSGTLIEVEFGLTAAFKAVGSATADLIWKWQARDSGGTWVDLHAAVTETNIGTTYVERTRTGYFALVANFDALPFDIRLILQCNELNEGRAKVKNSSYVRFMY